MAFPVSEMDRTSRIGAGNAGVALFLWEKHGGKNGNDLSMQTWETQERKVVEVAYEGWVKVNRFEIRAAQLCLPTNAANEKL
jgi:hypothetical protein